MPVNEAIRAARDLEQLRDALNTAQDDLAKVNAYRVTLQQTVANLQAQIATARAALRSASGDL